VRQHGVKGDPSFLKWFHLYVFFHFTPFFLF
jgi:hypothetical protein